MATLIDFLAHAYAITVMFLGLLFLQLLKFLSRGAATRTTNHQLTTAVEFLKLVEENIPSRRYQTSSSSDVECMEPCAVCLSLYEEGEEVRNLKCRHMYHKGCLDKWLQQYSVTCPLCRRAVLPEKAVEKHLLRRSHHYEYDDELEPEAASDEEELMFFLYAIPSNVLRRFLLTES